MSKQKLKETSPSINIENVLAYLKSNPDTVSQYPQLLEHIQLSDKQNPGVASLIEKQAAVLREKLAKIHRQMEGLITSARENESIQGRVFDLAIEVMSETTLDNLLSNLYNCLQDRFSVDFVSIKVPLNLTNNGLAEFNSSYQKDECFLLALERIGKMSARCDQRYPESLLAFLFEDGAKNVSSAALLPLKLSLGDKHVTGLLALGAISQDRFSANLGTHYLERIGDIAVAGMSRIITNNS